MNLLSRYQKLDCSVTVINLVLAVTADGGCLLACICKNDFVSGDWEPVGFNQIDETQNKQTTDLKIYRGVENVNRGKLLFSALLMLVCGMVFTVPASAHSVFKKNLSAKYPNMKVSCTACHDAKDKKIRNGFGTLLQKQFSSKTLTADFKTKKGAEKKEFEKAVMTPEFEKAFEKVKTMTVDDLVKSGFFDGIEPKESAEK